MSPEEGGDGEAHCRVRAEGKAGGGGAQRRHSAGGAGRHKEGCFPQHDHARHSAAQRSMQLTFLTSSTSTPSSGSSWAALPFFT